MAAYGGEMEQKLMDMEAEMNRFEEEINTIQAAVESEAADYDEVYTTGVSGSRFILGAKTYDQVQAQLNEVPLGLPPPPPPSHDDPGHHHGPPGPPPGPPPPPHQRMMPPGPPRFVPPQLRFRYHPPPMAPHGPPRMPFMHGHGHPPMPRPLNSLRPKMMDEGPKTVYASAPVIKKPEKEKAKEDPDDLLAQFAAELAEVGEELTSVPIKNGKRKLPPENPKFGQKQAKSKLKKDHVEMSITEARATASKSDAVSQNVGGLTGYQGMPIDTYQEDMELQDDPNRPAGKKQEKGKKSKKFVRTAAGQVWEDESLADWDTDDFRVFCGDLGNEVSDELLTRTFSRYPSFKKAKVVRDKRTNKTRGYGFISFSDPNDLVRAMREMNGKYVGNRPIKLRKSTWSDRNFDVVRKKEKEKKRLGFR